jgi:predicted kinase
MTKTTLIIASEESRDGKDLSDADLKKISRKYELSVRVPKKSARQQFVLCPIGLVGSGKTTVIKPISRILYLVRISSDEIRKILKEDGFNYVRTIEAANMAFIKFLNQGYNIAIDADCIQSEIQEYFNKLGRERKLKIIWIHINPPEKFIINKLSNYKHTWLFKDAAEAIGNYQRRKTLHEKYLKTIDFYYKFDTSKDGIDSQIDEFVGKIRSDFEI